VGQILKLTNREHQILKLLAKGLKDLDIALHLKIELETVKSHNKNVFRKLKVRNRAEAVLYCINNQPFKKVE